MPAIAAIGGFLGTAGGATIASAAIGAAGTLYAGSQAKKAAQQQAGVINSAADQALAAQQAAQQQTQQNNAPFMQGGYMALDALLGQLIPNYQAGAISGPGGGASKSGQTDWNAYLANNPDAAAWVEAKSKEADAAGKTREEMAAWHWQLDGGHRELTKYPAPATSPATGSTVPQVQSTGYGPVIKPRTVTPRPSAGTLDVSLGSFKESPDYQFRLTEGNRNILANRGALGALESGDAMKRLTEYGQNLASGEYKDWRNYTTGQFNIDRDVLNRNYEFDALRDDSHYESDRGYDTSRFDRRTTDLFGLLGLGQSAASASSGAAQSYANNTGNILATRAAGLGDIYGAQAENNASMWNNILGIGQNVLGRFGGQSGAAWPTRTPPIAPPTNILRSAPYSRQPVPFYS